MTDDERAQEARARELREAIDRLKRGASAPTGADGPSADGPTTGSDVESDVEPTSSEPATAEPAGAEPADSASIRDWINKRMAEVPFEPDGEGGNQSPSDEAPTVEEPTDEASKRTGRKSHADDHE